MSEALESALRTTPQFVKIKSVPALAELPSAVSTLQPHIAVVDLGDRLLHGTETLLTFNHDSPGTRVVVLLPAIQKHSARLLANTGVRCFVHASATVRGVIRALQRLAANRCPYVPGNAWCRAGFLRLTGRVDSTVVTEGLSLREREVLRLLIKGCTSREMGERLFISHRTVENHVASLFRKLDVHDKRSLSCPDVELDGVNETLAAPRFECPEGGLCEIAGSEGGRAFSPGSQNPGASGAP